MKMELTAVQKLMEQFEDSTARELELTDGDFHLRLSKNRTAKASPAPVEATPSPAPAAPAPTSAAPQAAEVAQTIKAPLVGTVYLQPKPGAKPYLQVGQQVNAGDVVCVIEAMKMMTEVKSQVAGTVKAVLVEDEQLVEVDQPLFTVE
ncbi:Acetyl-CoA carboxylase, biotin carboxyl carrier protein [Limosilactobacillus ingluviei DSM 15946]|uniref:Biotin carboxyl carrier protein of acetyl-CoA carboxylase n=3 Tax=Limosilactobacillus ingluviei TaxID=148604 RepID=A0A0R2GTD3_9LACO|nr:Acetyl-CoA carboxylase, biotin carboxyl carrier protein [Limosilactobacillus ingluviei DSM 15946]KRN44016.1 Acetyl-CoA carboxylase, biotin carboxyl carrier protein [Limosilactobacillus ingluviei]